MMPKAYTNLWYDKKKRKPVLRVKILKMLALNGEFSKKRTESHFQKISDSLHEKKRSHYAEISEAYDRLSKIKFVEPRHSSSSIKEKPYGLTLAGLEALFYETDSVEECWRYVIGFCANAREPLDIKRLSVIYDTLMMRFLPYSSIGDYSYILKIFWLMSKKFIDETAKEDNFAVEVLMTLAKRGGMSLEKIASETGKASSIVKVTLQKLTTDCDNYSHAYEYWMNEGDPEIQRLHFIDFLEHCLIFSSNKKGQSYYELSLFGIFLLLKILRDKSTIYPFTINRDYNWEKNLEHFASIFCYEKLPLIFGKWSLLKKYLRLWRFYNFDGVISNENERKSSPLVAGGMKELSESTYSMYYSNWYIHKEVIGVGIKMLEEFEKDTSRSRTEFNTEVAQGDLISSLGILTYYLWFREKYLNIEMDIGYIFNELKKPDENKTRFSWGVDRLLPIKLLEKSFEDEITLAYYINLMEPLYIPFPFGELIPSLLKDDIELRKDHSGLVVEPFSPTAKFRLLLEKDSEIRKFILDFKIDSFRYLEDLQRKVKTVFESFLKAPV